MTFIQNAGGVGGYSQHSNLRTFQPANVFQSYLLSFLALAASFVVRKNSTPLFSISCSLFSKNTRGGGTHSNHPVLSTTSTLFAKCTVPEAFFCPGILLFFAGDSTRQDGSCLCFLQLTGHGSWTTAPASLTYLPSPISSSIANKEHGMAFDSSNSLNYRRGQVL